MTADHTRYEFGPLEQRGLIAGVRGGKLAVIGAALLAAVLTLRVDSSGRGLVAGVGIVAAAAVAAFVPVGGRTLEVWVPVTARWVARRARRRNRYRSAMPLLGIDADGQATPQPPDTVAGVRILSEPVDGAGPVGILHDRAAGSYGAVLVVRGDSLQLADDDEKTRRLAGWGGALAALGQSDSPVHRLQWLQRTVPDDGDELGRYLASAATVDADHPSLRSYLELVDMAGPTTQGHETLLVVAISAAKARKAIKTAGGGDRGAATVLLREVRALTHQLASADITVEGALTPRMVARALRTGFDPDARVGLARRTAQAPKEEAGTTGGNAWPLATEATWRSYRSEGAWHATFWIAQWPRTPVGPDFLAHLLLGTTAMRSVSLTMSPVPPARAQRDVESSVMQGMADDELRARAGFMGTARRRRQRETALRREQELADGHSDYRLAGYITVTASDPDELEVACGEVQNAAARSLLELRRLYGEQDLAFTYTLPLARGLHTTGLS